MGDLSRKDKVCIFIFWALVLMCCAAERDYFPQSTNLTWDEARNHCQVCFKELVTLTPENIQAIALNITSDCWVGLRKNFNNSTVSKSSSMSWSRWANGDPLTFQNWYPGWPVSKPSPPKRYCCTCSATTTPTMTSVTENVTSFTEVEGDSTESLLYTSSFTDQNWTNSTANAMTTQPQLEEAECAESPGLLPDVPETDKNYIDDSCVAMLSFGAWVEKKCSEILPFICYEERFSGQVKVTDRDSERAVLTWQPGPGNISHYRLEVNKNLTKIQTEDLTHHLVNLTAGTRYSVQVFPVKCERDLNPQEVVFYTTPNKVVNLTVTKKAETSVSLSWKKPAGNLDFYLIKVQGGKEIISDKEGAEVGGLTPGNLYTFTVLSGVLGNSTWSEESSITARTRPGKVSNLTVSEITKNSLKLHWVPPNGKYTGFRVRAVSDSEVLFNEVVIENKVQVTNLPIGSKIILSVTALASDTLEGDSETVVGFTAPGPISGLVLDSTNNAITATWNLTTGDSLTFNVKLLLDGKEVDKKYNLTEHKTVFDGLKTAAKYTVVVLTFSGHLEGLPESRSIFTKPSPPTNVAVTNPGKNQLTVQWTPPANIASTVFFVKINSSFWGHSWSDTVINKTSHTFTGLKSGTRYDFEVRMLAGDESSTPEFVSHSTVAEERELILSMLCSSAEPLLCANQMTQDSVFQQLDAHFHRLMGENIFWELEKQEIEN